MLFRSTVEIQDINPSQTMQRAMEEQAEIEQEGEAQIYETSQFTANGEIRQVRISKQNYELNNGEKIGFCIVKDVTQSNILKKNAQKQNEIAAYSPSLRKPGRYSS